MRKNDQTGGSPVERRQVAVVRIKVYFPCIRKPRLVPEIQPPFLPLPVCIVCACHGDIVIAVIIIIGDDPYQAEGISAARDKRLRE
jgi:hypothetical protein